MSQISAFPQRIIDQKYAFRDRRGRVIEAWPDVAERVAVNVMGALGYAPNSEETRRIQRYIEDRKFLPGGRYLYAAGRDLHQVQNCLLLRAEDSREGWGDLWHKAGMALMTGAGIGVDYTRVRAEGSPVRRTGGFASGPISLAYSVNEIGRQVMQGGSRRSAIWAGLRWDHPDIFKFIRLKDWSSDLRLLKERDITFPLPMELTNISVILDDEFFEAYENLAHPRHGLAHDVYWKTIEKMCRTAEPGFSVDTGDNAGESLRNACTEVTSRDDSDICNLGSLNLGRIANLKEFLDVQDAALLFLLAGTVYSHVPYPRVGEVRALNRRLGLGLMGVHEWLLKRGRAYGPDAELETWLRHYATSTDRAAHWAAIHSLSRPIKTRAIAPTGTIGIIGETTTGIEPVFCTAFKRLWLQGNRWVGQYVVDPTAERLIQQGVPPHKIEDAYQLSLDVDRRIEMQAWVQRFVDHGISSTINLPEPWVDAPAQDFGNKLLPWLPRMRGVTVYPNGARAGQPLQPVSYDYARKNAGVVFEESEERCVAGACGV